MPVQTSDDIIRKLDAWHASDEAAQYKQRSYELVPRQVTSILDVGCGTGDDVLALAEHVGGKVEVLGVDCRLGLVEEASRRARNVALQVRFAVGDARSLPFENESFDVVRVDGMLNETTEVRRVVRELVRVLRVGGLLLVHERESVLCALDEVGSLADGPDAQDSFHSFRMPELAKPQILHAWQMKSDVSTHGAASEAWLSLGTRKLGRA